MVIICKYPDIINEFKKLYTLCKGNDDITVSIQEAEFDTHEEYTVLSDEKSVVIRGGRVRALYYGVYSYFEKAFGVSYFWDTDIVPENLTVIPVNIREKPAFEYRGLRYFAHRGLYRFQAEMWSYSDWEKELRWLLKKRFNLFMLRIGVDDLFQKAFPDICKYPPKGECLDRLLHGFDDRTDIYSLEERGILRKRICCLADSLDLIQPIDCGTMTHWYSRTPRDFIENENPDFLSQTTDVYSDKTGLVWDIRKERNLKNYFKLTKAYTDAYGQDGLFHTIGLAERLFSSDRSENLKLKIYTYKRICEFLKAEYPFAKLLIASWDFSMFWHNDEVAALVRVLDPERCIILDYTSDTSDEQTNFTKWGITGKFPYIFGIFHAYESSNEIRGNYSRIEKRLSVASHDSMCCGLVTWQELSHGDMLMLEYASQNAWSPLAKDYISFVDSFCDCRYTNGRELFKKAYQLFYPISSLTEWGGDKHYPEKNIFCDFTYCPVHSSFMDTPFCGKLKPERYETLKLMLENYDEVSDSKEKLKSVLLQLDSIILAEHEKRDLFDIKRTLLSKDIHYSMIQLGLMAEDFRNGANNQKRILAEIDEIIRKQSDFCSLLGSNPEYTLKNTLARLENQGKVNPYFKAVTIKENTGTEYCRTCIYETFKELTIPETKAVLDWIKRSVNAGVRGEFVIDNEYTEKIAHIRNSFINDYVIS